MGHGEVYFKGGKKKPRCYARLHFLIVRYTSMLMCTSHAPPHSHCTLIAACMSGFTAQKGNGASITVRIKIAIIPQNPPQNPLRHAFLLNMFLSIKVVHNAAYNSEASKTSFSKQKEAATQSVPYVIARRLGRLPQTTKQSFAKNQQHLYPDCFVTFVPRNDASTSSQAKSERAKASED